MNIKKHIKSDKFKWIITFVSMVILIGLVVGLCANVGNLTKTKSLSTTNYTIGNISETGTTIDSRKNIYSDMFTTEDLEIKLDENATITYKVVFYDEDKDFVSTSASQSADFVNTNIPATAEYCRVVITPLQVDSEDVIINIFNMANYTNQLDVSFAK